MANWLDKYEQGGLVLKKKTKDNYGKRENANEGRSTAGPGWIGEGTTNRGFNYNGAWGGTMEMGGSMPGTVGFTYARVAGSAPANGKYTKKTKASAQNGQEMKFYQEGLDFKPKTISKNGSVIKDDLGQWAHPGEITQIGSNEITMKGVDYPVIGISDTGDTKVMYPGKDYKFDGNMVTEYPLAQDGENITKKLKKEAEEKLERMKKPKATVSQYTPKKGEAERLDREKLQRIEESYQPLNRFASSKAAKNLQDAALFATDAMVLGEGALATKGLLKNAYTNIIDDAVKAGSNAVKGLDLTKSQQGPKLISSFDELYKQRLAEELSKRHGSLKIDPTTGESYKVVSPKLYKEASRNYEAWYEGADRTLNKAANLQTSRYSHNFFNSSLEPIENKELLKGVRANYRKNKNGGWLNKYK